MKGQRLFVRRIVASDAAELERFLSVEAPGAAVPAQGLLGRIVGDLVAIVALDEKPGSSLAIAHIVVAERYRRKRIGRMLVEEAVTLARASGCRTVEAPAGVCDPFFERNGFTRGDGMLVRRVG